MFYFVLSLLFCCTLFHYSSLSIVCGVVCCTDLGKQWAAVTTKSGAISVPPQVWERWKWRLTCQGQSPRFAADPPMILDNFCLPQSTMGTERGSKSVHSANTVWGFGVLFIRRARWISLSSLKDQWLPLCINCENVKIVTHWYTAGRQFHC
jgi:hypothetical protein